VTSGSDLEVRPSLAKTGRLVFSSLIENADIWSLPIDTSLGQVKGSPEQVTHNLAADYVRSMSADGKQLTFTSLRSGSADIWLKDLETGREKPIVASPAEEVAGRLSPDGTLLSYSIQTTRNGVLVVDTYLIPVRGGLPQKLCGECGYSWGLSPDNKFLFFFAKRGTANDRLHPTVALMNLATGKISDYLQSSRFSLAHPNLTHDGRWITFSAIDSPTRSEILVTPFEPNARSNESDWIRVVSDQHWNHRPHWSPDGNRIYFLSDRDGFPCLWTQRVDSETKQPVGSPQLVYDIHQIRRSMLNVGYSLMDLAVAPDKIMFNQAELTGNIWMTRLAEDRQK